MKAERKRFLLAGVAAIVACMQFTACSGGTPSSGSTSSASSDGSSAANESTAAESSSAAEESTAGAMTHEEIIRSAAAEGMVGNWGLGNEYEIQALLTKYGLPTDYITQDFTMDQFDSDSVKLASAMTYNELGLVVNSYDGG